MSSRMKKAAVALLVMALLVVGIVGAAQAQTPDPNAAPDAAPNRLQQMQEWMGPEAWGQMIQRMTERMGAEATGQMLQRMASGEDCHGDGEGQPGMMGGRGMMGRSGRGMGGWWQGMGSWH